VQGMHKRSVPAIHTSAASHRVLSRNTRRNKQACAGSTKPTMQEGNAVKGTRKAYLYLNDAF
jgi:hypothetical protein